LRRDVLVAGFRAELAGAAHSLARFAAIRNQSALLLRNDLLALSFFVVEEANLLRLQLLDLLVFLLIFPLPLRRFNCELFG